MSPQWSAQGTSLPLSAGGRPRVSGVRAISRSVFEIACASVVRGTPKYRATDAMVSSFRRNCRKGGDDLSYFLLIVQPMTAADNATMQGQNTIEHPEHYLKRTTLKHPEHYPNTRYSADDSSVPFLSPCAPRVPAAEPPCACAREPAGSLWPWMPARRAG